MAEAPRQFGSDLHALLAGGITAVLDFRNLGDALHRRIEVTPQVDDAGNYRPEWVITVGSHVPPLPEDAGRSRSVFRLRLEQEQP